MKRVYKIWIDAARPRTLPAAISPVLMGGAMAWTDGVFYLPAAIAALVAAVLLQIAANYANDYYDYVKGADTGERLGPMRATQAGWVTPLQMRHAAFVTLALAVAPGLYLIYRGGWPVLVIGLFSMLFAIIYTGGPLPLGYLGVADFVVLLFFGPIAVGGTYYVQAQQFSWTTVWFGIAPGLLSTAILSVNNLRDREQDQKAGKKTLAVRFGLLFVRMEYLLCVVLALVIFPLTAAFLWGRYMTLIAWLAIPIALVTAKTVFSIPDGTKLNACLAQTGKLLLLYCLLFSAGWLLGHI